MEQKGIPVQRAIIEYPTQRKKEEVKLSDEDRKEILVWEQEIENILSSDACPRVLKKTICKSCSYYEFCYVLE